MTNIVKYHSAVIFVRDIAAAKHFYIDLLGMEIALDFGTNVGLKGGLALWQIDPAHIIPQRLGAEATDDRKTNRCELYFETEDLDTAFGMVKASNVEFLHELHEEPREAADDAIFRSGPAPGRGRRNAGGVRPAAVRWGPDPGAGGAKIINPAGESPRDTRRMILRPCQPTTDHRKARPWTIADN